MHHNGEVNKMEGAEQFKTYFIGKKKQIRMFKFLLLPWKVSAAPWVLCHLVGNHWSKTAGWIWTELCIGTSAIEVLRSGILNKI
jgi:hypothetical protein